MKQKETRPVNVYVRIDLNKLPSDIGYHAPNGRIEVSSQDYPAIVEWVKEKVEEVKCPGTARKVVDIVSWCPNVLSMILGAVLTSMYLEGEIDGLRNFHPNGVQHDILGKDGFVYLADNLELETKIKPMEAC
ncbi:MULTISPECIES: hypothetical protein [Methanosarcina]|nr:MULTISPECIES: hypothetical protein [Methanosarcina]AKB19051.1 hypothetical protein MSWHS_2188 [Methanosarcina sp. WWM596]